MRCEQLRDYTVVISDDALPDLRKVRPDLAFEDRRALAVMTPTVDRLYGESFRRWLVAAGLDAAVEVLPLAERTKTMESALQVTACAQRHGLGRRDVMVAFGGGLCSDVVAVAASLTRRGIAHVTVPTTLVGQVDAGIGLKGGVNFGGRKNYLGCFSPPESALINPAYLRTLPIREIRCGVAEIMKMALIRDRPLFEVLRNEGATLIHTGFAAPRDVARHVIARSVQLMLEELQPNSYEDRTLQRLVDFGHTFSSTLEERSEYRLRHGEAVAVDMALSCDVAVRLGILDADESDAILETFTILGLPVSSRYMTLDAADDALAVTIAHRGGRLNLVVPRAIGEGTFVVNVGALSVDLLQESIDSLRSRADQRPSPGRTLMHGR